MNNKIVYENILIKEISFYSSDVIRQFEKQNEMVDSENNFFKVDGHNELKSHKNKIETNHNDIPQNEVFIGKTKKKKLEKK